MRSEKVTYCLSLRPTFFLRTDGRLQNLTSLLQEQQVPVARSVQPSDPSRHAWVTTGDPPSALMFFLRLFFHFLLSSGGVISK